MPSRRDIDFLGCVYEETLCFARMVENWIVVESICIYILLYIVCWLFYNINFSVASPIYKHLIIFRVLGYASNSTNFEITEINRSSKARGRDDLKVRTLRGKGLIAHTY